MTKPDRSEVREAMTRHLRELLSFADENADYVLGALVCDAQDHLRRTYYPDPQTETSEND